MLSVTVSYRSDSGAFRRCCRCLCCLAIRKLSICRSNRQYHPESPRPLDHDTDTATTAQKAPGRSTVRTPPPPPRKPPAVHGACAVSSRELRSRPARPAASRCRAGSKILLDAKNRPSRGRFLSTLLVARFTRSCGACFAGAGSSGRPLSFPPCRLIGRAISGGWPGQRIPGGWPGQRIPGGWPGQRIPGGWTVCYVANGRFVTWQTVGCAGDSWQLDGPTSCCESQPPPPQPIALLVAGSCDAHPSRALLARATAPAPRRARPNE